LIHAPRNLGATTRGAPAIWTQISNAPAAIRSFEGLPDGAAPGTAAARIQVSCALLEVARLLGVPPSEALAILGQAQDVSRQSRRVWQVGTQPGDRVALTGDMSTGEGEIKTLAERIGLGGPARLGARRRPWLRPNHGRSQARLRLAGS